MTIKDIAKECGYAVGTVSRVLNGNPNVSEKAREKVMEVVNRYGFVLNNSARQLKSNRSHTIAVIIKGTSTILLNNLHGIIQHRVEQLPYLLSAIIIDEYDDEVAAAVRVMNEQRPVGIIFLGGNPEAHAQELKKITVPCVLITNSMDKDGFPLISSVTTDDTAGAECCARYLIENGHRKICVIGGDLESSSINIKRYQGFLNALKDADIPFDFEKSYYVSKYDYEDGARAAKTLLQNNPDMTAIFTMSDLMAIGACRQLVDMGIKVPSQISITGYDGNLVTEYYTPRLTTIKQDETALANTGLDILLERIGQDPDATEQPLEAVHIQLPFTFVKGESVARLQ